MSTRIGIIGDIHARAEPLQYALQYFQRQGVNDIFCSGDICGYHQHWSDCVDLLRHHDCKSVLGNHDQEFLQQQTDRVDSNLAYLAQLPLHLTRQIENSNLFMVHAEPPNQMHGGIKLLDQAGDIIPAQVDHWREQLENSDFDILIVGHTHQVYAQHLGEVLVINPGSTVFNHSAMILTLPEQTIDIIPLQNRQIIKCWNFSHLFKQHEIYPVKPK